MSYALWLLLVTETLGQIVSQTLYRNIRLFFALSDIFTNSYDIVRLDVLTMSADNMWPANPVDVRDKKKKITILEVITLA